MTNRCSPVALFGFNRPIHMAATIDALKNNDLASSSDLTIFCDGPRSEDDYEAVDAVRKIAHATTGFKSVSVVEQPHNIGLANSVISGVTKILEESETIIVVEDDLITAPFFLDYMNDGLSKYANEDRVLSICGYTHPTRKKLPEVFLLPGAHCWGWATWRRGWEIFEHDPYQSLKELDRRNLIYKYDVNGAAPYTQFLLRTASGEGDSWALRWMASAILNDKVSLYPGRSLVLNIGNEGSGTNAVKQDAFDTQLAERRPDTDALIEHVDDLAYSEYRSFLFSGYSQSSWKLKLYYQASKVLPTWFERWFYTRIIRRSIGQISGA